MRQTNSRNSESAAEDGRRRVGWLSLFGLAALALVFLAIMLPRQKRPLASSPASGETPAPARRASANARASGSSLARRAGSVPGPTAEEIVAGKVERFARSRRGITRAMAGRFKVTVPDEVERFYDAVAAGRFDELNARFKTLQQMRQEGPCAEALQTLWGPILEALLISENVHDWPAQQLLDYGNSILSSLRPGMVYVGGTDPGRGIPTFLNATSDGEQHTIITQNALADASYLQYVSFLYGDQMAQLTPDESKQACDDYVADARQRLLHDTQFPDEPPQLRPGEDVRFADASGTGPDGLGPGWNLVWSQGADGETAGMSGAAGAGEVVVSGQVAVMAINEQLLRKIMDKNPDLTFAIEESFPLKSTYADASLLGPLMELRAGDSSPLTAQTAAQSLDYWRDLEQSLNSDPDVTDDSAPRRTWSKMAVAQGNLLADHQFNDQAEQAYKIALQICPYNPEAVFNYAGLLLAQGRWQDAASAAETAVGADPANQQFQQLAAQLRRRAAGTQGP
jgi:tetratricopeptide (TPR) repeat protein